MPQEFSSVLENDINKLISGQGKAVQEKLLAPPTQYNWSPLH
jgi:hypothetical protein